MSESLNLSDVRPEVRPWVRYWAKYFDILVFSFAFGLLMAVLIPQVLQLSDIILGILILFLWVFFEAFLLNSWGTTPGKWLLKVRMRGENDSKLSFSNALNRGFGAWFKGLALGIPLITLVTMLIGYRNLVKNRTTSWDRENHVIVTHGKVGPLRTVLTVLFFTFVFAFLIWTEIQRRGLTA